MGIGGRDAFVVNLQEHDARVPFVVSADTAKGAVIFQHGDDKPVVVKKESLTSIFEWLVSWNYIETERKVYGD